MISEFHRLVGSGDHPAPPKTGAGFPRVVHVITALGRGGAEQMLVRLLEHCEKQDRFHVVSLAGDGVYGATLRSQGISVTTLNLQGSVDGLRRLPGLVGLLRALKPDIVQCFMYHANLYGGIAARLAGVPAVIWGIRQTSLDRRYNKSSTIAIARAGAWLSSFVPDRVVSCSEESSKAHIAFGYSARRMAVIPNGFDLYAYRPLPSVRQEVRSELGLDPETPLIGMVARFDRVKDHRGLLAAFREVLRERRDCRLLLCGQGIDQANSILRESISDLALEDRVVLLGPRSDITRIMNGIDIHVLASSSEGFPNVLGEAMACGTPCVATDVGDSRDIVGDTGWIVPQGNPSALALAIIEAIGETASQRGARGDRCRKRIEERYEIRAVCRRYEDLWHELATVSASAH